jgi:hypothetical protein
LPHIIHVTFIDRLATPPPLSIQAEVHKMFPDELGGAIAGAQGALRQRLAQIIDTEGGRYLKTGRDIVRALNALRLHGRPVRDLIDIPDMVWLQLVRIGNPALYSWVEEYLVEAAAVVNGASISNSARHSMVRRLVNIIEELGEKVDVHTIFQLAYILPGVDSSEGKDTGPIALFKNLRGSDKDELVASRRLGSPEHYRLYFTFSQPAGTLRDEQVQAFIDTAAAAELNPTNAIQMFVNFSKEVRPQGGTMAEVLIDRVTAWSNRIPEGAIPGILACFAQTMDSIEFSAAGDFLERSAWRGAARAVKVLLGRTSGEVRARSLRALFTEGQALGWLTHLLRTEIFSHGHYGDRPEPEDRRLVSAAEFGEVLSVMLKRYREASPAQVMGVPDLLSLLYAWLQGGGPDEPTQWVSNQIETNSGLLALLSRVRSWAATSGAVYHPLKRRDLEKFFDFDEAVKRLEIISKSSNISEVDRQLASELLVAVEQGNDR